MSWRTLLYRLGLLMGLALFGYQFWQALTALWEHPGAIAAPWYLGIAVVIDVLAYLCLMLGWAILMRAVGVALSPTQIGEGYMLSFLPRYVPGTIWGYLSRSEWLARSAGVGYRQSGIASALEIGLQVVTAATVAVFLLASPFWRIAGVGLGIGVSMAAWYWGPQLWSRLDRGPKGVGAIRMPWRNLMAVLAVYAGFWYLHGLSTWLVARSIGAAGTLTPVSATPIFAASWLIGFLVVLVPSGLGVREWTLNYLLVANAGMPADAAAFVAVVVRLAIIVAELLLLLWAATHSAAGIWRKQSKEEKQNVT